MTIHSHQDDYYEFLIEIPDSVDVPTELPAGHYYLFKAEKPGYATVRKVLEIQKQSEELILHFALKIRKRAI